MRYPAAEMGWCPILQKKPQAGRACGRRLESDYDTHRGGALNRLAVSTDLACMFSSLLSWNEIVIEFYASGDDASSPSFAVERPQPHPGDNDQTADDKEQSDLFICQQRRKDGSGQREK